MVKRVKENRGKNIMIEEDWEARIGKEDAEEIMEEGRFEKNERKEDINV